MSSRRGIEDQSKNDLVVDPVHTEPQPLEVGRPTRNDPILFRASGLVKGVEKLCMVMSFSGRL